MLEHIADSVPVSIIALDLSGTIVFANPSAEKLMGLELYAGSWGTEGTGRWRMADARRQGLLDQLEGHFSRLGDPCITRAEESLELEWGLPDESPRHLFVRFRGLCEGTDNLRGWICAILDITEQKESESKLRESEAFYRTLFEHAGFGIGLVDPENGRRVAFNRTLHERLGYTREEYEHLTVADIQYDDTRENVLGRGQRALQDGSYTFEERQRTKDGRLKHVLVSAVPVTIDGKVLVHAISLDITEKKQMEIELRQAQKMEAVGRLAGGVAHDFNNMLNVMIGYADLALLQLPPDSELYGEITEIRKASLRSAELTKQLLAFSRKQIIAPRVVQLNDLIADQFDMLRRLIGEEIAIDFHPARSLWPIKIDPVQIHQILTNLAANARDAIDGIGAISIDTGNASVRPGDPHLDLPPGDYVLLSVADTGLGMDPVTLEHIFEPFFTTKLDGRGTGLGLATVYGIVKQNDGGVYVYSEPGSGTTVELYLPRFVEGSLAETEEHADRGGESTEAETRPGAKTLLVVEDEPALLQLTREILQRNGYRVIGAAKPSEALRLCREYSGEIDLLLTDVVMPEMNGMQLQEQISALQPGLKALFMSGHSADILSERGVIEQGINFINKPFSMKDLLQKVAQAMDAA